MPGAPMDEIAAFLSAYPPFDRLPHEAVALAAANAQIEYFAAGHDILTFGGAPAQFLYVVRQGRADLLREESGAAHVFDTLGPGEAFGHPSLIRGAPPIVTVRARTELLAYLIPAPIFQRLRAEQPAFASFFAASALDRLDFALQQRHGEADPALFQTRLGDLVVREPVSIRPEASIREAATLMSQQRVSCLLVDLPPFGLREKQVGIITDRDLRSRVLAAGLPDSAPVSQVMSAPATTLPAASLVFEGLLLMLERGIHHLPLTEGGRVVGIITHTDILRRQSGSPLFLPRQLERARSMDDLRRYCEEVSTTVDALLDAGARVSDIGRVVAVAHDALLQRLLRDGEAALGPPPAPYAWLVLGSEGRYEQTLRTDQDNALVYADDHPPAAPAYFAALAELVVERLVACGFPRCPGEIMATNPQWRQPLAAWQATFARWIDTPDEEALLRSAIFFDLRQVHGELDAEAGLRPIIERARGNTIFLARLARAALRTPAPLTVFQQIATQRRGEQRHLLDLKLRGTALIVDLARLFALEAGRAETSTVARLRAAWPAASLDQGEAEALAGAFELLSLLRLRQQRAQLERGEPPDNLIVVPSLGPWEQHELKASIQAIARVQRGLANAYQTGRIV
jgi:CBS domain-containing protein